MTMHPELEHAFDMGVSMQEVSEIFAKHYSGPKQEIIPYYRNAFGFIHNGSDHSSSWFWDGWHPLFRGLSITLALPGAFDISYASLNAHRALTRGVISWLCDSKRKSNIYLINKPWMSNRLSEEYSRAGVVGKICSDAQRSVHLSERYGGRVNIDQLSANLAAAYPPYRHILTQILIDYPDIHRLPQRALFKKLIHEPWKAIQHRHPVYITAPPVVILECYKSSHEDLFRLICEFGSPPHSSPLLWIVSVGPKYKLRIQDLVEPFPPRYTRLPVCYNEAPADAALILHHRFSKLRYNYKQTFDDNEVWPSDEQMAQMAMVVSGVFEFIDVIIQFVDWEGDGGPRAHLETFLGYMVDSPPPSDEQPCSALDHFYIRALSSISPDIFLDVKKIFNIIRWKPRVLSLPQLLSLGSFRFDTFLPYVCHLFTSRGYFWKNSSGKHFEQFVEDRNRSGRFYIPQSESRLQGCQAWLHFLSHSSDLRITLKPEVLRLSQADVVGCAKRLWDLRRPAVSYLCNIPMTRVNKALLLRHFDFRCLAHNCDGIVIDEFASLINDLYEDEGDNSPGIVRVEPVSTLDRDFVDKCQALAEPWKVGDKSELSLIDPKYVLLGYGAETVLAVMASREQFPKTMKRVGVEDRGGVTIYTSAMLDYM